MTNTDFDFDPLPGDAPAPAAEPPAPEKPERKKRGPKKGSKRGPRRVVIPAVLTEPPIVTNTPRAGESAEQSEARTAQRATRQSKIDASPEIVFIREMMKLTDATRAKVLAVLNTVFG